MALLFVILRALYHLRAYLSHLLAHTLPYLRPSSAPYPSREPVIAAAWLTRVLQAQGRIGSDRRVAKVECVPFDAAGYSGLMRKVEVTYENEANKPTSAPRSFVLKMSGDSVSERYNNTWQGSHREAFFYNHPYSKHANIPGVVYAYGSKLLGEYLIITEDVRLRPGFAKVGWVFGNQIWGLPDPPPPFLPDPVDTLRKMFLSSAELHAKFWKSEALLKQHWLREANWYSKKSRVVWEMSLDKGRTSWQAIKRSIDEGKIGFKFSPKLRDVIDTSFAKASWESMQAHLQNPALPWTLCHGDYHAGNLIMAEGEVLAVDWSQVGVWEPTTDLAQTIISDVKPEVFIKHTRELVRAYWERIIQLGIVESEYPFNLCWESFCRGGPERWIYIIVLMTTIPGLPTKLHKYFHDQLLAFIEAHGDHEFYVLKPLPW